MARLLYIVPSEIHLDVVLFMLIEHSQQPLGKRQQIPSLLAASVPSSLK